MLTQLLTTAKLHLRSGPLRRVLDRAGVLGIGRSIYNRRVLKRGLHETVVMGTPLRFAVSSEREIVEIDALFQEEEFLTRLLGSLKPGDVVYDVGANLGVVSLLVAVRLKGSKGRVHAFEPEPRNAAHLRRNVELNDLGKWIDVHEVGLGRETKRVKLYVADDTGFAQGSILSSQAGERAVEIALVSATEFARTATPPDVVKIDVEGAEMEVLLGMAALLEARAVREVFVEVHLDRLPTTGCTADDLQRWLEAKGYAMTWSRKRGGEDHQHFVRRAADAAKSR